jgi:hypothetical protein
VKYDSLFTRLVAQTEIPDEQLESTGCWLADGKMDRSGYVFITKREPGKRSPVNRRGHREMETIMRGSNEFDLDDDPLGPILVVEHLCYNRRCWNPDHHTTMTRVENTRSMLERTRG